MTVAELRKALEGVPDNLPVYVYVTDLLKTKHCYMREVEKAVDSPKSSISSRSFDIETGRPFCY